MTESGTSGKERTQKDSATRRINSEVIGRKDWGYTNHYRRMMMQRTPTKNAGKESEK